MNFKDNGTSWSEEPHAQRDWYNGIEFRSKLESKTAQAFDNIGIRYKYEPDGYKLSNGMWYKPDFYLPDAHQFVECKGKMSTTDSAKIVGLVEDTLCPVLVISYENAMLVTYLNYEKECGIVTHPNDEIFLAECERCGGRWFVGATDWYKCRCCGAYDGDGHIKSWHGIGSGTDLFNLGQRTAADKPIYREMAETFNG